MQLRKARRITRWIVFGFFAGGSVLHFAATDALLKMVPDFVPYPKQVILLTGMFELLAAIALLTRSLRTAAGVAFAVYTLCVWPANFKHALDGADIPPLPSSWWYHAIRLALQPVIAWAALFAADVIDWPFRDREEKA